MRGWRSLKVLKKEKTVLERDVSALRLSVAAQYEDGFNFALEQVTLVFPDLDDARLGEVDAMNQIV
ncbi:hypothetical protein A2U01_0062060, partial [Trifolium medium]|nr:hypothetical protein [Trifolium medium]